MYYLQLVQVCNLNHTFKFWFTLQRRTNQAPRTRSLLMPHHIDQSGKIEDTNKLTVIAFANGKVKSLKITAVEKQKLIKVMREMDYPKKVFIFKIFACLIYVLLKDEKWHSGDALIIDREYKGHEGIIKDVLLHLFRETNNGEPAIQFSEVGRKSLAHLKAIAVFRGEVKPDIIVKAGDVLSILYKQKNLWSARSGRENP